LSAVDGSYCTDNEWKKYDNNGQNEDDVSDPPVKLVITDSKT
jgi:hypothetical protein